MLLVSEANGLLFDATNKRARPPPNLGQNYRESLTFSRLQAGTILVSVDAYQQISPTPAEEGVAELVPRQHFRRFRRRSSSALSRAGDGGSQPRPRRPLDPPEAWAE